jgi:hypothetical protein
MGRYAFFSTNLEYKFRFGVQDSEDIRRFGGVASYENYEKGYLTHSWNLSDKETIEAAVKELLNWLGEDPVDFQKYTKTIDGTWKLKSDLYTLYTSENSEEIVARYILGCLIYHQLLYSETLSADYEG